MDILNREKKVLPTPETVAELKRQSARLDQVSGILRQRDRTLFDMINNALQRKDTLRAQIYANELARVRNVQRTISQSQLAIDCIAIRLESFLDFCQIISELKPVTQEINAVSYDISQIIPQFSSDMELLRSVAGEALKSSELNFNQQALDGIFNVKSQEGSDILKEVSSMIESNLHSSFPEPPVCIAPRVANQQMEAVACSTYGTRIPIQTGTDKKESSQQKNSMDWSVLSDEVLKQLDTLSEKNRVKMEETVA